MNANRYVFRPSTRGPCRASPVQISFGREASNRPNTPGITGLPVATRFRPVRTNIRCNVRSSGAQPCWADRIRRICAADRDGFSFFNADANSSTSAGVRGCDWRGEGTSASNPARCHSEIHRSNVHRLIRIDRPSGSVCVIAANARTSLPRCRPVNVGSAASLISM